jgi:hypothetical protein
MTQRDPLPPTGGHGDASGAKERGTAVAHETKDEAASVARTAQHEAGRVADEVRHQTRDLVEDARHELHQQARTQTEHLGGAMSSLGERMHALAEGRPEDAGQVQDVAHRIADQVEHLAHRVDELGFDGAVSELQRFARRRPGAFLAGAAALGFAASRLARGATDDGDTGSEGDRVVHLDEPVPTYPAARTHEQPPRSPEPLQPPPASGPSNVTQPVAGWMQS